MLHPTYVVVYEFIVVRTVAAAVQHLLIQNGKEIRLVNDYRLYALPLQDLNLSSLCTALSSPPPACRSIFKTG